MAGLAAGSAMATYLIKNRFDAKVLLNLSAIFILILSILFSAILKAGIPHSAIQYVFSVMLAAVGSSVGFAFPAALGTVTRSGVDGLAKTAGNLYGADLTGSAGGALLASAFLIPIFGITSTCYLAAGIIAAALIIGHTGGDTLLQHK